MDVVDHLDWLVFQEREALLDLLAPRVGEEVLVHLGLRDPRASKESVDFRE